MLKRTLLFVLAALMLPGLLVAQQSAPAPSSNADYVLGAGDEIIETVINHPEFSTDLIVPQGGAAVFPVVGTKNVQGMTIKQLTDLLTKGLKVELNNPRVAIILKTPRLQQVFVYGDVQKPGPVPLLPGMKLSDAFNSAGGLNADFKIGEAEITLLARGGTLKVSPLEDVLENNGETNQVLHDGDTVNVDAGWYLCYVVGQVKTPGQEHMKRGTGIMEAVAAAGGVTPLALISQVQITHVDKKIETVDLTPALIHGDKTPLPDLQPGDLITVPESLDNFSILGYVNTPGVYPIPQGRSLTLADAVSTANGQEKDPSHRAKLSLVRVDRRVDGKQQIMTYNLGKYLTKGDITQNPKIEAGDVIYVPETDHVGAPTLASILSSATLFYFFVK